jgi:AAA family ATP:ADP antiporter
VIFERAYTDQVALTRMYGRLGWISSGAAIVAQVVLVPLLLPRKRIALLLPPAAMLLGALGAFVLPGVVTAIILSAADRGLNYSLQQATKESLYVPLSDAQKYKAKAFIDMFVDRAAKALAAFTLIGIIHYWGASVRISLGVGIASMAVWLGSARALGAFFKQDKAEPAPPPAPGAAATDPLPLDRPVGAAPVPTKAA